MKRCVGNGAMIDRRMVEYYTIGVGWLSYTREEGGVCLNIRMMAKLHEGKMVDMLNKGCVCVC